MAASVRKMVGVCEDSSSSDDEALRRCQEAVWDTRRDTNTGGDASVQQSKRLVVAKHEHDGNELQVTEGFRTHVAKKLGTLLDSCISETRTETSSCVESANRDDNNDDDDDEGFRLFSTSVPGQTAEEPPAAVRRRPAPSSSDSDSEMETRLKEAAVSVKDLLPSFSSTPAEEPPCSETPKKKKKKKKKEAEVEEEDEESCVVKKKKKRKQTGGESDSAASPLQQNGSSEPEPVKVKQKKKKKKKREGNGEEQKALD
ncbi:protein CUSTOS-like isoform X1 [Sparus aurata]|uniref:protein CUSTOS-like isoform X1 n=1 Tax=Sparus aurata TaxID=8175 RepID=UPI0011C11EAC|nr:protein CUSTOS-like isoform X1 [Sparus aurata]